uniref:Uncharacterized protein n=1 Tax=Tetranychus urticae TaxID=32264 RepID=T1L1T9_TETUR
MPSIILLQQFEHYLFNIYPDSS